MAGDFRGVDTPVLVPNTEVKDSIAEGSAGLACVRVGRRRPFFCLHQTPQLRPTRHRGDFFLPANNAKIIFYSYLFPFPSSLFPIHLQCFQDCVMFRPNVTPYPENAVGARVRTARKSRDLLRVRPLRAPAFSGWCVPQGDRYMPRLHGRFSRSARRQRRLRSIASGVDAPSKREYVAIRLGRNTSRRRLTRLRAVCRIPPSASRSVSCPSHLAPARYWSPKRRFFTAQSSRLHLPKKNCQTRKL